MKPRLLDLFCGAGGAAMGYHRAGFDEIVGVDINPQPHYPFTFIQADAMEFPLEGFDLIHASPPCQAYSRTRVIHPEIERPDLLPRTRTRLQASGIPWIIENVPGAPMKPKIILCGQMFELPIYRHRLFETSFPFRQSPQHPRHKERTTSAHGGAHYRTAKIITVAGYCSDTARARAALGTPWMSRDECNQAIPPAYTEYIGKQIIQQL